MTTISVKSCWSRTPSCAPTCRITISVSPRAFMRTPSATAWRCRTPESRAAAAAPGGQGRGARAEKLPADRDGEDRHQLDQPPRPDPADVHLQPRDDEED